MNTTIARRETCSSPPIASRAELAFCESLSPLSPRQLSLSRLYALLTHVPSVSEPHEARAAWFVSVLEWLQHRARVHELAGVTTGETAVGTRFAALTLGLKAHAHGRIRASALLSSLLGKARGLHLFAEVGIPSGHGFFSEAQARLARKLIPRPPNPEDLSELLLEALKDPAATEWLEQIPPARMAELVAALNPEEVAPIAAQLERSMQEALSLLTIEASCRGLAEDIRARTPEFELQTSPFQRLSEARGEALAAVIAECRGVIAAVNDSLECTGVSVDLVYRLDRIERELLRLESLTSVLGAESPDVKWERGLTLLSSVVTAARQFRSLRSLVRNNTQQLARKIVESAGHTGEHYITHDAAGHRQMIRAGAGGGALTSLTAAVKMLLYRLHMAPFFDGLFNSLNYAIGFVAIQLAGFTLATKQPATTGAALAHAVKRDRERSLSDEPEMTEVVALTKKITRSQLAAAFGNVFMVFPVAFVLASVWKLTSGTPMLTGTEAEHVVHGMHPFQSGLIFYGAFTGVLLWLGSVAAGWIENFSVYRRIPEAIAGNRTLRKVLGVDRCVRWAEFFRQRASSTGGSIALGFLLGMVTPILSGLFGIGLEVRHVTLSTGTMGLAAASLPIYEVFSTSFAWGLSGIVVTLFMNFSVSFTLALLTALRAHDQKASLAWKLAKLVGLELLQRPRAFFLPPRPSGPKRYADLHGIPRSARSALPAGEPVVAPVAATVVTPPAVK